MRSRPGTCCVYDCPRRPFHGELCWQHAILRRRGKLSEAAIEGPPAVSLPAAAYAETGAKLMCAEWDCERSAEPGSDYCRVHRR